MIYYLSNFNYLIQKEQTKRQEETVVVRQFIHILIAGFNILQIYVYRLFPFQRERGNNYSVML